MGPCIPQVNQVKEIKSALDWEMTKLTSCRHVACGNRSYGVVAGRPPSTETKEIFFIYLRDDLVCVWANSPLDKSPVSD